MMGLTPQHAIVTDDIPEGRERLQSYTAMICTIYKLTQAYIDKDGIMRVSEHFPSKLGYFSDF